MNIVSGDMPGGKYTHVPIGKTSTGDQVPIQVDSDGLPVFDI